MNELEKDIIEFRDMAVKLFEKSHKHKSAIIAQHCINVGAMIALITADESNLLDAIDTAHKQIREHATNSFVEIKKIMKEAEGKG